MGLGELVHVGVAGGGLVGVGGGAVGADAASDVAAATKDMATAVAVGCFLPEGAAARTVGRLVSVGNELGKGLGAGLGV